MLRNETIWDKIYQEGKTPWDLRRAEPYLVNLTIPPCRMLDIGCGPGNESISMAKKGFDVTGIDISHAAIKQANDSAHAENVNIHFIRSNFLEFETNKSFDFALDRACFHFFDEKERNQYIEKIAKLLRSGGTFLLFVSSDQETPKGPFQFSESDIRQLFSAYFTITKIELVTLENHAERPMPYVCTMTRK